MMHTPPEGAPVAADATFVGYTTDATARPAPAVSPPPGVTLMRRICRPGRVNPGRR